MQRERRTSRARSGRDAGHGGRPEHSVFLPSLRAGQVYDYEVRVAGAGLGRPPLHRGQVTTDTLPSDLAAVHFTSLGTPTERLTMVGLRGSPFSGWDRG